MEIRLCTLASLVKTEEVSGEPVTLYNQAIPQCVWLLSLQDFYPDPCKIDQIHTSQPVLMLMYVI